MVMMMFFGFSFGAAIAGFLAAAIIPRFGWQAVFYVGGILPLLYLPVQVIMLPESIRVLALRGNEGPRIAALLARMDPRLIFGAATRFVIHEEHAAGLPVRHLFREGRAPSTALVWFVFFANLLTLFFLVSWLPTVIGKAGVSPGTAVVASSLLQIGGCVGVLLYGPILDRFNPFMVLGLNYLFGAIFIPLIGASGSEVALVMAMIFFSGISIIGGQNAMNAVTATLYPTYIRSTGVGWALGIGRIGAIIGPIIGGALLASQIPLQSIFFVGAVSALCTAAGVFLLGRAQRRRSLAYSSA